MNKDIKSTIIISDLVIVLILIQPVWERCPGGFWNLLFYLFIGISIVWMLIKIIIEIVRIFKKRKSLTLNIFTPLIILIFTLLILNYTLSVPDNELFFGKVTLRACYEGTQNQAVLKLRNSGRFEIHQTGVFFYDRFYTGKYKMSRDTIFMDFNKDKPRRFGDTLVIKNNNLFFLEKDSLKPTYYYLGYCKDLN